MAIDIERVVAAAVDSFLHGDAKPAQGSSGGGKSDRRKLGGAGAVALGVGAGLAARALYRRVRDVDLERVAGAVEDKLRR